MPASKKDYEQLKVVAIKESDVKCSGCKKHFRIGDEALELPSDVKYTKKRSNFFCHGNCFATWSN